jgi:hypothetical protein
MTEFGTGSPALSLFPTGMATVITKTKRTAVTPSLSKCVNYAPDERALHVSYRYHTYTLIILLRLIEVHLAPSTVVMVTAAMTEQYEMPQPLYSANTTPVAHVIEVVHLKICECANDARCATGIGISFISRSAEWGSLTKMTPFRWGTRMWYVFWLLSWLSYRDRKATYHHEKRSHWLNHHQARD